MMGNKKMIGTFKEDSSRKGNLAATFLFLIGWITIIGGFIAGCVLGSQRYHFDWAVAFTSWIASIVGGAFIIGFSSIISLLQELVSRVSFVIEEGTQEQPAAQKEQKSAPEYAVEKEGQPEINKPKVEEILAHIDEMDDAKEMHAFVQELDKQYPGLFTPVIMDSLNAAVISGRIYGKEQGVEKYRSKLTSYLKQL